MATEHKPTPWSVTEHPDNGEEGLAIYYINSGDNTFGDVANTYIDDGGHNARRIVACVNACAEFSTEVLESAVKDKRHRYEIIPDCVWHTEDSEYMVGTYEGTCGIAWTFTEGDIKDNEVNYCPRCGGKVIDHV